MDNESMTLRELVRREINFFEGFEMDDTVAVMDVSTQNAHRDDFRLCGNEKTIAGIPVINGGAEKSGFVLLTSRYLAGEGGTA